MYKRQEQLIKGIRVYPADRFNPLDSATGRLKKTENTWSIHWYSMSWLPKGMQLRCKLTKACRRLFGKNCLDWLKRK